MRLRALPFLLTTEPAFSLELTLPILCTLGEDCFVQQYVDREPGPVAADYRMPTTTPGAAASTATLF